MNKETKTSKQQHPPYTAVKNALAGKGLTYKDVANVLGLTEATVQQKLNGGSDFYITERGIPERTQGITHLLSRESVRMWDLSPNRGRSQRRRDP